MERNTALILLGFDPKLKIDKELVEIAFEEAIFTEASFFMRRNFIPKLAEVRILKLTQLAEAGDSFGIQFTERRNPSISDANNRKIRQCQKIIDLVKVYQNYEMEIKLNISNEENPNQIIHLYQKWISLFSAYSKRFISLFENLNTDVSASEISSVSITQIIDYNDLMTELSNEIYTKSVLKEYLRIRKMKPITS